MAKTQRIIANTFVGNCIRGDTIREQKHMLSRFYKTCCDDKLATLEEITNCIKNVRGYGAIKKEELADLYENGIYLIYLYHALDIAISMQIPILINAWP